MPLMKSTSKKAFGENVATEMREGKSQPQSLAIAYSMKRRAAKKKMAMGGQVTDNYQPAKETTHPDMQDHEMDSGYMDHEGDMKRPDEMAMMEDDKDLNQMSAPGEDMVSRIIAKRMSKGGMVANKDHGDMDEDLADFKQNEFDDLALRDDLESSYTGTNSGDELSNKREDMDRKDIVSRIMASRRKKDRLPSPA